MIVMGGLNPIAALHEAGIPITTQSLAGLEEFSAFIPFKEAILRAPRRDSHAE